MRRFLLIVAIGLGGCLNENNIDPGTPNTFIKSFNGGADDVGQMVQQTPDAGFIVLGTSEFFDDKNSATYYKIKLIKTDQYGNIEWQQVYPPYPVDATSKSYRGKAVQIIKDATGGVTGYAIVGDDVEPGKTISLALTSALVITTSATGVLANTRVIPHASNTIQGKGITQRANGNFLALATTTTQTANMLLAELSLTDLSVVWSRSYGNNETVLANKIFTNSQSSIYWAGSVITNNDNSDIRLVKTFPDEAGTDYDLPIGKPTFNEAGNDICRYGTGFAVIGTTNETEFGDTDIQFTLLTENGIILSKNTFGAAGNPDFGYSICATQDGGVVMIGAIETARERDYYLIKVNAFGDTDWEPKTFGSRNNDDAASIIQASDGGYVILGTTEIGGLTSMMLMKTNSQGDFE